MVLHLIVCVVRWGGGQDPRKTLKEDDGCGGLAQLLREPLFLTSMVHALEEQKTFTIQHKSACALSPATHVWMDEWSLLFVELRF